MQTTRVILALVILFSLAAMTTAQDAKEPVQSGELMSQQDPNVNPPMAPAPRAENPMVLRVNGDPVYAFEISMVMQTIQTQLEQRGQTVDQAELAKSATQRVIEQKLLVQEARRFGLEPDELEVARAAQTAEQQAGGRTMLVAKLKATGSNYEQFLNVIRDIDLLRIFVEQQIKPNIVISDEDVAAFYEENPDAFEIEDSAHAYHMIFVTKEGETDDAARARAGAARTRASTSGEDFTVVARELSEGPSAPDGGDLGWVSKGMLVSPLSEAVFELKPGEISEVIQSRFGYHVFTVTEERPAGTLSLEEASDQIAVLLRQQKSTETLGKLLETLVEKATVENLLAGASGESAVGMN